MFRNFPHRTDPLLYYSGQNRFGCKGFHQICLRCGRWVLILFELLFLFDFSPEGVNSDLSENTMVSLLLTVS